MRGISGIDRREFMRNGSVPQSLEKGHSLPWELETVRD